MKKLFGWILIFTCILTFTACTAPSETESDTTANQLSETTSAPEGETTSPTEETTTPDEGTTPSDEETTTGPNASDEENPTKTLSEAQWRDLFVFESVKVKHSSFGGDTVDFLICGDYAMHTYEGEETYLDAASVIEGFDFSNDYGRFSLASKNIYVAKTLSVGDADFTIELSDVTVTVSGDRIYTISYALDMGMLGSFEEKYVFTDWGEVSFEIPEVTMDSETLYAALDEENFKNCSINQMTNYFYTTETVVVEEYLLMNAPYTSSTILQYTWGSDEEPLETTTNGIWDESWSISEILSVLYETAPSRAIYDPILNVFSTDQTVTITDEEFDTKRVFSDISFMIEDGYLTYVSYSGGLYLQGTPVETYYFEAILFDYGTTEFDVELMEEEAYAALLSDDVLQNCVIEFTQNLPSERLDGTVTIENGTGTSELYGTESGHLLQSGTLEELLQDNIVFDFLHFLRGLDAEKLLLSSEDRDGTCRYYYVEPVTYLGTTPDFLDLAIFGTENAFEVTFAGYDVYISFLLTPTELE